MRIKRKTILDIRDANLLRYPARYYYALCYQSSITLNSLVLANTSSVLQCVFFPLTQENATSTKETTRLMLASCSPSSTSFS
jgi:hypothetical protein